MRLLHVLCCFLYTVSIACSASAQQAVKNEPLLVNYKTIKRQKGKYYKIEVVYPVFADDVPVGRLANRLIRKAVSDEIASFGDEKELIQVAKQVSSGLWLEMKPKILIARRTLISLYLDVSTYGGGAHPNRYFYVFNVGIVGGKPKLLRLSDILWENVEPEYVFTELVVPLLNRAKSKRGYPPLAQDELERSTDTQDVPLWDRFIIAPGKVTWLFEPYSVGPFSEGSYIIRVPKQRLERFLKIEW